MSGVGERPLGALVVGGGPAGLATSRELQRRGVSHRVLERGPQPGWVWANLYDSLTLHTGRHLSHLPGRRHPWGTPMFLARADFVRYLDDYATHFRLPIDADAEVTRLDRQNGTWVAETSRGLLSARTVVLATGIVSNPRRPAFPGRDLFSGQVLHSSDYRRPDPFVGQRVLVVGIGKTCSRPRARLLTGRTSTRTPRRRCATPRAPRATPRACSTATARRCCTPMRRHCPMR